MVLALVYFALSLVLRAGFLVTFPLAYVGIDGPLLMNAFYVVYLDELATQHWDGVA